MSNKNFLQKQENSNANKIRIINELDDDRMQNNIKKFNFILEDANTIRKKKKKESNADINLEKDSKKDKKNTINKTPQEYLSGVKSREDPSFFKFQDNNESFDKELAINFSNDIDEDKKENFNIDNSLPLGEIKEKETDIDFFQVNFDPNNPINRSNMEIHKGKNNVNKNKFDVKLENNKNKLRISSSKVLMKQGSESIKPLISIDHEKFIPDNDKDEENKENNKENFTLINLNKNNFQSFKNLATLENEEKEREKLNKEKINSNNNINTKISGNKININASNKKIAQAEKSDTKEEETLFNNNNIINVINSEKNKKEFFKPETNALSDRTHVSNEENEILILNNNKIKSIANQLSNKKNQNTKDNIITDTQAAVELGNMLVKADPNNQKRKSSKFLLNKSSKNIQKLTSKEIKRNSYNNSNNNNNNFDIFNKIKDDYNNGNDNNALVNEFKINKENKILSTNEAEETKPDLVKIIKLDNNLKNDRGLGLIDHDIDQAESHWQKGIDIDKYKDNDNTEPARILSSKKYDNEINNIPQNKNNQSYISQKDTNSLLIKKEKEENKNNNFDETGKDASASNITSKNEARNSINEGDYENLDLFVDEDNIKFKQENHQTLKLKKDLRLRLDDKQDDEKENLIITEEIKDELYDPFDNITDKKAILQLGTFDTKDDNNKIGTQELLSNRDNQILSDEQYQILYKKSRRKINLFNSINDFDVPPEENYNYLNVSEESIFYNDPYFQKEIYMPKEKTQEEKLTQNKSELIIREKLMYFYLNPRKNNAMPKFMKVSEKEKKCQEILTINEAKLPDLINNFYDDKPFIRLRKFFFKISSYINRFSLKIVKNPFFDNISLFVILINTLLILISDPIDSNSIANTSDDYFLYFYTTEMFLKIFAFGFIIPDDSYLKDLWNILDFLVIFVGWISILIEKTTGGGKIQGLSGLRTFRILRPLKTVKSIKGLRRIISTLLESMLALGDILIVLFFFFLIFAVAGVQMWQGNYLQRCVSSMYGYPLDISSTNTLCTSSDDCKKFNNNGHRFICVKINKNPNNDCTHFDDTLSGLVTVFIIATMEGWTDFWNYTSNTFKDTLGINAIIIFFYFHILLFVGGYYLINLFLAVILTKFSEVETRINEKKNKHYNLYTYLIQTFDKTEDEENENNEYIEEEEELEKLEDKQNKMQNKIGIFKYKASDYPISYNLLSDIFLLKTYTPQELFTLKKNLLSEAKIALNEYNDLVINHRKVIKDKLNLRKKTNIKGAAISTSSAKVLDTKLKKIKESSRTILLKRRHTYADNETKIDKISIYEGLHKTLKYFEDVIKNIKKDAQMRIQQKKILEESRKKKTYLELLKKKIEETLKNQEKENESSSSDNEDEGSTTRKNDSNLTGKPTKLSKTVIEDKKEDLGENNIEPHSHISFSMDTSDEDSFDESNQLRDKIADAAHITERSQTNIYLNTVNSKKKNIFGADLYVNTSEGNELLEKENNQNLNKDNTADLKLSLIKKRELIDKDNRLYNKVIINKPKNPMLQIMKQKDETIRKKKIEILRDKFSADEYISKLKPTLRNKLGRGKSFLNILKFTDETNKTAKKETIQEIKDYDDLLDDKQSLDISKQQDELIIVDTQSDINQEELITKKNEPVDEYIDFDEIGVTYEDNNFTRLAKNEIFKRKNQKRNTDGILKRPDFVYLKQLADNQEIAQYNAKGLRHSLSKLTGLVKMLNSNKNIKDDNDAALCEIPSKKSKKKENKYNNYNELLKFYEKSKSFNYNKKVSNKYQPVNNSDYIYDKSSNNNKTKTNAESINNKINHKQIRSFSIKKNGFKFPGIEKNLNFPDTMLPTITKEQNRKKSFYYFYSQEPIAEQLTQYRKYMRYVNFCMDKDFKIQDEFKVDDFIEDVMGKNYKEILNNKKKQVDIDPFKIFNNSKLQIKTSSYLKYIPIDKENIEYKQIINNLKFLTPKTFLKMSDKNTNFRLALKNHMRANQMANRVVVLRGNLVDKNITSSHKITEFSKIRTEYENIGSVHKSRSLLTLSSATNLNKKNLKVIENLMKNDKKKIFDNFISLDYSKKIEYLFTDDKLLNYNPHSGPNNNPPPNNPKENNYYRPQIKLEINSDNFDVRNRIKNIRNFDAEMNTRKYKDWSAQQVMNWKEQEENYKEWNALITDIENTNIILWSKNTFKRLLSFIKYYLFKLSISQNFDFFIIFVVILNVILMIVGGNLFDPDLQDKMQLANYGFTAVFMLEFLVKFIGLGPIIYFSDPFTYLDIGIICFAILDMASAQPTTGSTQKQIVTSNSSATTTSNANVASQLSFLRVFRIFRVTRIAKVLKKIKHFRRIIKGITTSLSNVSYNLLICLIFLLIFQLLGMNLLNSDPNYSNFMNSFYITFQILTLENWNGIYYNLSYTSKLTLLYLITWIFLGNYVLFNLFISILLSSFEILDEDNLDLPENIPEEFKKLELLDREMRMNSKKSKAKKLKDSQMKALSAIEQKNSDDEGSEEDDVKHVDQDISLAKYTGVKKMIKEREIINSVFKDNECEFSLCIFSQTNKFRLWCMDIITLKKFDNFILLMILLSTLRLIIDTFISGQMGDVIFDSIDIFFTFVFLFEMILKIVSLGFVIGNGTYLKDNWNRIDFIIVVVSIIDLQGILQKYAAGRISNSSLNFLRVLRLLRTLRPLRFISHNVQLKIIITALFDSIVPITNVLIIVVVVLLVFSIVGMNLFYDLYHTCYTVDPKGSTPFIYVENFTDFTFNSMDEAIDRCKDKRGIMDASPTFKFSNILTSLISSYVLANSEGWPDIMASYNQYNTFYGIFFIAYWFIVSTFFMNIFVGILFSTFNDAWNKENKQEIVADPLKEQYYDFLKQIEIAVPEFSTFKKPDHGVQLFFYNIVSSSYLENFIMMIIVSNMITMAINYEGMSDDLKNILDNINLIFTVIFIIECIMKLIANGVKGYFYFAWNKFDFFVVASSLLDLTVQYAFSGQNIAFLKSFQIFRVLRVLRVTRVLRLVKSLRGLEKLLQTLRWSIDALMNVFILLFLIFCIFSIVGYYLFNEVSYEDHPEKFAYYNQYYNFDNFYNSFILCFRTATGENWPMMMVEIAFYDEKVVAASTVFLYFIFMNFITYTIMLNLFLLVTLQQYDDFHRKKTNPIEKFNELLGYFKKAWNKFSTESDEGYRIKNDNMTNFILLLEGDLNKHRHKRVDIIKKYIMDLMLLNDDQNYVYFHDVLFKMIKYEYGRDFTKKSSIISKEEEKLVRSIKTKIDAFVKEKQFTRYKVFSLNTFNPLTTHLYFKVSFKFMKQFLINYMDTIKEKKMKNEQNIFKEEEDDRNFLKKHVPLKKKITNNFQNFDYANINVNENLQYKPDEVEDDLQYDNSISANKSSKIESFIDKKESEETEKFTTQKSKLVEELDSNNNFYSDNISKNSDNNLEN